MRILLAEDNRINQRLVAMLLGKADNDVEIAENGEMAVEAICEGDFDVVLMDVHMPVLDGIEATRRIRGLAPPKNAVPIIALTADAMAGAREECLAADLGGYLSKPLDDVALFSLINDVTAGLLRARPEFISGPREARTWGRDATISSGPAARPGSAASAAAALDVASVADRPNFDAARLPTIAGVTADKMRDLLECFLLDLAARGDRIGRLAEAGDLSALAVEAHVLIGMAGNFGALRASQLAAELRATSAAGDCAESLRISSQLSATSAAAAAEIRNWLERRIAVHAA
jgi:CheY-like chemotaxis protein